MAKNINSLQLLRNTKQLYATKAAAISGITGSATNDGTVKLARYKETVTSGDTQVEVIKTIFGIYSIGSEISGSSVTGGSYTIYDSPQEVIEALEKRVKANEDAIGVLNGAATVSGSVAKSIKDAIDALNADVTSTGGNHVTVKVNEANGKITGVTVTENNIASAALLGKIDDTADKDTAFGKIAKEAADRATAITNAINALDVDKVGGAGKIIEAISEANGKISATTIDFTAENVAATATDATDEKVAVEGNTVEAQIASLAKSIKTTVADAKSYSVKKLTEAEVTALGEANVKEAYQLIDEDSKAAGETIKIYKDSSLESVALSGQTLNFTYILADGSKSTVGVDVSTFLAESEFKNGLEVVNHLVNVKIDAASESFLTVGEGGVKLSGVTAAINAAAAKATTKVVKVADADKITLTSSTASDGSVTYTIGQSDIASAALLGTAADDKEANTAFGKIAKEVADREAAISGLNADVTSTNGDFVNVQVVEAGGKITAVTVTENDIASASGTNNAINAEKSARETEDAKIVAGVGLTDFNGAYKIAANTGTGESISAASTVKDAIYTLDNAIAAAKKANTLEAADKTVVVVNGTEKTTVKVNIASNANDSHKFVTFDESNKLFYFTEAILDAGTY